MKQKELLYFTVITALVGSIVFYSVELKSVAPTNIHFSASESSTETQNELPSLTEIINEQGCFDLSLQNKQGFNTQAYRGEVFKDDRNWLISHYNKAFSQGEGACGSNSLDTALYGQKAMIGSFVAQLEEIEKKKGKNAQYDYVRQKALELKALAGTRSMRQGEWLNELGYGTLDIQKRPLTIIDGLEAFFPNIINQVKSRGNSGYTPDNIYEDAQNSVYTNGYEFVDSTINLSIPFNSPDRSKPRWKQEFFSEFIIRTFDPYDANHYLATINNNQDERLNNASQNPRLSNGKTLYTMYKERLLNYKKFTPYVSNLEKMRASTAANNNTQVGNSNNSNKPIQDNPSTVIIPTKPIDQTRPITDPRTVVAPNKGGGAIIIPLPPTRPQQPGSGPSAGGVIIPDKPISNSEDTEMRKIEEQRLKEQEEQKKQSETITETITAPTTIIPINLGRTLRF